MRQRVRERERERERVSLRVFHVSQPYQTKGETDGRNRTMRERERERERERDKREGRGKREAGIHGGRALLETEGRCATSERVPV